MQGAQKKEIFDLKQLVTSLQGEIFQLYKSHNNLEKRVNYLEGLDKGMKAKKRRLEIPNEENLPEKVINEEEKEISIQPEKKEKVIPSVVDKDFNIETLAKEIGSYFINGQKQDGITYEVDASQNQITFVSEKGDYKCYFALTGVVPKGKIRFRFSLVENRGNDDWGWIFFGIKGDSIRPEDVRKVDGETLD